MQRWRSWSGAVRATPDVMRRPTSVGAVVAAVSAARDAGAVLRVAGSGHSFSPIAASDRHMMTLDAMPPAVDIAPDGRSATVGAGVAIRVLNRALDAHDLALATMGGIDHQVIAGALATGTHGTGGALGPMHTMVEGIELVDGTGALHWLDAADLPAGRLAIGALGVVTRIRLGVVPAYRLATTVTKVRLEDALVDFDHHVADHRHAELYWLPHTPWAQLRLGEATEEPALPTSLAQRTNDVVRENAAVWAAGQVARTLPSASPLIARILAASVGDVSARRPSHQAFASVRWARSVEMEHALPRAALPAVIEAINDLITGERLPVVLPVEVRAVAADDSAWLSPAWGRDSAYVAVHAFRGMPCHRYFRAVEEICRSHDGRPHWGKMHTQGAGTLAGAYPRWADFQAVRARLDPDGTFASPYLRRILG